MKATLVELSPFERYRKNYLDDESFRVLQQELMQSPLSGDVIMGTGGLRKLRFSDPYQGKGKRGGTRIIYYWWDHGPQFWLFTLYNKDELADLTNDQRQLLSQMLKQELKARGAQ